MHLGRLEIRASKENPNVGFRFQGHKQNQKNYFREKIYHAFVQSIALALVFLLVPCALMAQGNRIYLSRAVDGWKPKPGQWQVTDILFFPLP